MTWWQKELRQKVNKHTASVTENTVLWTKCHNWVTFWCKSFISVQICNKPFTDWPLVCRQTCPAQSGWRQRMVVHAPEHSLPLSSGLIQAHVSEPYQRASLTSDFDSTQWKPDSQSVRGKRKGSIIQLVSSRVTGKTADLVASTQSSLLGFRGSRNCVPPSHLKVQLLQIPVYYIFPCDFARASPRSVNSPSAKLPTTILIWGYLLWRPWLTQWHFNVYSNSNCLEKQTTINRRIGKLWERWKYQTTWPASWETCIRSGSNS